MQDGAGGGGGGRGGGGGVVGGNGRGCCGGSGGGARGWYKMADFEELRVSGGAGVPSGGRGEREGRGGGETATSPAPPSYYAGTALQSPGPRRRRLPDWRPEGEGSQAAGDVRAAPGVARLRPRASAAGRSGLGSAHLAREAGAALGRSSWGSDFSVIFKGRGGKQDLLSHLREKSRVCGDSKVHTCYSLGGRLFSET